MEFNADNAMDNNENSEMMTCPTCGASVPTSEKEMHEQMHAGDDNGSEGGQEASSGMMGSEESGAEAQSDEGAGGEEGTDDSNATM